MKKIYGLTGGIASGKTTVTKFFTEHNIEVIDCDLLVNELYKDKNFIEEVKEVFKDKISVFSNKISRVEIAKLVFNDKAMREKLNKISHPRILKKVDELVDASKSEKIVISMPLLFEINYQKCCEIICVYTNMQCRVKRLVKRDRIEEDYAKIKIASQMDLEEKKNKSDYVIDNSYNIIETKNQCLELIKQL